nr:ribonuclease H-like domain-containing protein [Tanacetum cinerariifolium]
DKVENTSPQSTPQVFPSFEEYTPSVTYPEEVEDTIGILMEVETLDHTKLEDLGLNTCNHDIPLSSWKIPSFDEPEPQPNPLTNCPSLDVSLREERGHGPPIKPHSPDSFRMKVVDNLTIHTLPSPHVTSFYSKDAYFYYHPCIDDPKKHYGFKQGRGLNSPVRPKEVEKDKVENTSPQSTPQVFPSFEEYTPSVTYPEEVEDTIGIPMEVETLDHTKLEDLGLNTCNHDIPLSSWEIPSFDEPEPQPNPLTNCPSLDVSLREERGPGPPIKPHSPDSFRMKVVDNLTIHTLPSPHVTFFYSKDAYFYYHPCIDDPKKHYGFKPGRGLNSPVRPKEVEKVIFDEKKLGSS